ncbi:MAG TPA: hypothetical protein VHQ45_15050 [Gemmatimonadaceae bacterium]|jgi:hypothetical protein|nr:hypothetical protein [Gemmatimonadaceae bacterium]
MTRRLVAAAVALVLVLSSEAMAQSPEDRASAALAAVEAFRVLKPGGRAVIVPSAEIDILPAVWERHGFRVVARDTTARAAFRVRRVLIAGDTAAVIVEAALRDASGRQAEWRDFTLVRDGDVWVVSDVKLILIT